MITCINKGDEIPITSSEKTLRPTISQSTQLSQQHETAENGQQIRNPASADTFQSMYIFRHSQKARVILGILSTDTLMHARPGSRLGQPRDTMGKDWTCAETRVELSLGLSPGVPCSIVYFNL
eukprot:1363906-Amorphochlora_amoeboformis.AAC.1